MCRSLGNARYYVADIEVEDGAIHIHGIGMEERREGERVEKRRRKLTSGREWVLVRAS